MKKLIVSLLFAWTLSMTFAMPVLAQTSSSPIGHWHGTLDVGVAQLRLWLEVSQEQQGQYRATLESIDQAPGQKMEISKFSFENNKIAFSIPSIGAQYQGEWHQESASWQGEFKQGKSFKLAFKAGPPAQGEVHSGLDGLWKTDIEGHPLLITVTSNKFGTQATLASPDEGVEALPIAVIKQIQQQVIIEIPFAAIKFKGELAQNERSFTGKWKQKGQPTRTLTFTKQVASQQTVLKRPQMPVGDLPYVVKNVRFKNAKAQGVELAGTLTLPNQKGHFPAAILISGSGPQDRDETFMDHKPFAVLADHLTRQGIAVLRYDDRGVAESTGNHSNATSLDFASDVNAAFEFLRTQPQINPKAIGLIGHSEGGLIAPLAAKTNTDIGYLVMLAGPGVNTVDLMLAQQRAFAEIQQVTSAEIDDMQSVTKALMTAVKNAETPKQAQQDVMSLLTSQSMAKLKAPEAQKDHIAGSFLSPWYQYFIKYEPAQYFKDKSMPILAFYGELDIQVTAKENYAGLSELLGEHQDSEIMLMPKMNHLFQEAKTGAMTEYRNIEQTMSPKVLNKMSEWINTRF